MMKNLIEYKGYSAKVRYLVEDQLFHGKIEGIKDLVTFECKDKEDIKTAFCQAVDDYLIFCEEMDKEPEKYGGTTLAGCS